MSRRPGLRPERPQRDLLGRDAGRSLRYRSQQTRPTLEHATAGLTVDGRPELRDGTLADGGRILYAVDADASSCSGGR